MLNPGASLPPGFRFHPTDEELILHYLKNRATSLPCPVAIVAEVDIYKFNPWDLPAKAYFGDKEWYFFTPRDRKYPNGIRPNRAAASGYWKATGTDKPIVATTGPGAGTASIGVKKALVFYRGKPPKGRKTSWIMHEYRLTESLATANASHHIRRPVRDSKDASSMRLDDWVLCRIYKKTNNPTGTQRATTSYIEEEKQQDEAQEVQKSNVVPGDLSNMPSASFQQNEHDYRFPKPPSLTELVQNSEMLSYLLHDAPPVTSGVQPPASRFGQHGPAQTPYYHINGRDDNRDGASVLMNSTPQQRELPNHMLMTPSVCLHARSGSTTEDGAGDGSVHPSNRSMDHCSSGAPIDFSDQFFNNLNQTYVNQNPLWNPYLGLHR